MGGVTTPTKSSDMILEKHGDNTRGAKNTSEEKRPNQTRHER